MKKYYFLLFLCLSSALALAQEIYIVPEQYNCIFRLKLKDKGTTPYTLDQPQAYLSDKAIERRTRQGIAIDSCDLPISAAYVQAIEKAEGFVVAQSKWLNTITVFCDDSSTVKRFTALPFVDSATFVWRGKPKMTYLLNGLDKTPLPERQPSNNTNFYGFAQNNIKIGNGQVLHQAGYKGKGIDIAVIDAGFNNLPKIEMLDNINIKGQKGFVFNFDNLYWDKNQHGLNVLSCMATNKPHEFVGTAPEASYWLLGSEDPRTEYPVEEDYWVAAMEYADSVGVDVVNTSLGYSTFNFPAKSYTVNDLDGKKAFISQGANRAITKGIFVVCSAGNSGDSPWKTLTPPGDAQGVLTVGAVQADSVIARFSSVGFTADMRIKPEVVALGVDVAVIGDQGVEILKDGTSFSSPIMCGMVACLWQAFPSLTNKELLNVVIESANKCTDPDPVYGYGIPDMKKAIVIAQSMVDAKNELHKIVKPKR